MIDQDTANTECTTGEAEITYRGLIYWVHYTFRREYNDCHYSYDEEPTGTATTSLTIDDFQVLDFNDDSVKTTFNPENITKYFNTPDYSIDYRDER